MKEKKKEKEKAKEKSLNITKEGLVGPTENLEQQAGEPQGDLQKEHRG